MKQAPAEVRTSDVEDLLHVLAQMDDPDEIFAFFEDVFTVREIRESSARLAVARMLSSNKSYDEIERQTGVSAATIARVAKCLGYGAGGYRRALEILAQRANRTDRPDG